MGTTNRKPPGPIIMFGQSKTGRSSQIIFITLLSDVWPMETREDQQVRSYLLHSSLAAAADARTGC